MSVLTPEQVVFYQENGYIVLSGLVPDEISLRAKAILDKWVEGDPRNPKATSSEPIPRTSEEEDAVVACYTDAILQAAAELVGDDISTFPRPHKPYPLHSYPTQEEWKPWGAHIDHAIKEHGHKTFPYAFRLASMLFFSDVEPHGGGTLVWPGSHLKTLALAKSNPEYYELMYTLNNELDKANLGEYVELTPKRGDILFYHYLCGHSGSMNVQNVPRLAMNAKW